MRSRIQVQSNGKSNTKRWAWGKIFGTGGKKKYDRLVLIGVADDRHKKYYLDEYSPYVIFELSRTEAEAFTRKNGTALDSIKFSTGPKSKDGGLFLRNYQITPKDFENKYKNLKIEADGVRYEIGDQLNLI